MVIVVRGLYAGTAALWVTTVAVYIANGGDRMFDEIARNGSIGAQFIPQGSTPTMFAFIAAVALLCALRALRPVRWVRVAVILPVGAWSIMAAFLLSPWPSQWTPPFLLVLMMAASCIVTLAAVAADFIHRRARPPAPSSGLRFRG
jgi:hypothetical protein